MAKGDREATCEVTEGDFKELYRPHYFAGCDAIQAGHAKKAVITIKIALRENEKTGDIDQEMAVSSAFGKKSIKHKARIDNRQLVLID